MARIRTIKPDFFRHAGLFDAEQETGLPLRVAFAGLWTACDREGRFLWKPRELKLDALPHDVLDFSRVLDALLTRGFIQQYRVDGVLYGCIPSWERHQIINNRESASVLPDPAEHQAESTTCTREARVDDASATRLEHYQGEGKGKEGKGKEGKGKEGEQVPTTTAVAIVSPPAAVVRLPKPQAPTNATWEAYCAAYHERYGTDPVRNGKVNSQLGLMIGRIGTDEAPEVARFYVGHSAQFYVRCMHSVDMLLKDCEKLRTEWFTGRKVTATQAVQADRTATNLGAFQHLIERAELGEANGQR